MKVVSGKVNMQGNVTRMQGDEGGGNGRAGHSCHYPYKAKNENPSLYRVLILNDDYTPMEFVVHILERFSRKTGRQRHASCFTSILWSG